MALHMIDKVAEFRLSKLASILKGFADTAGQAKDHIQQAAAFAKAIKGYPRTTARSGYF